MAGLYDTDILLDDSQQLTQAASGDAPLASGIDCFLQDIRLEAMTQAGELWYDETWGWSLLDFQHADYDELTRIEIEQRIRDKLGAREEISSDTIAVSFGADGDLLAITVTFSLGDDAYTLAISLDRISVEVTVT